MVAPPPMRGTAGSLLARDAMCFSRRSSVPNMGAGRRTTACTHARHPAQSEGSRQSKGPAEEGEPARGARRPALCHGRDKRTLTTTHTSASLSSLACRGGGLLQRLGSRGGVAHLGEEGAHGGLSCRLGAQLGGGRGGGRVEARHVHKALDAAVGHTRLHAASSTRGARQRHRNKGQHRTAKSHRRPRVQEESIRGCRSRSQGQRQKGGERRQCGAHLGEAGGEVHVEVLEAEVARLVRLACTGQPQVRGCQGGTEARAAAGSPARGCPSGRKTFGQAAGEQ